MKKLSSMFKEAKVSKSKGFTLIEILVVIGIIAVLAAIVIVAINPARQFAQARNTQRISNVETILNAIGQNMADNKGVFTCSGSAHTIPTTAAFVSDGAEDLWGCLVPTYMPSIVVDPTGSSTTPACTPDSTSFTSYQTCYKVQKDSSTGRITISAPYAELSQTISLTR